MTTEAQPPVGCAHEELRITTDHEIADESGPHLEVVYLQYISIECGHCDEELVVHTTSQWAAVQALAEKWTSNEEYVNYPLEHCGSSAGRVGWGAAKRACADELERVTKGGE